MSDNFLVLLAMNFILICSLYTRLKSGPFQYRNACDEEKYFLAFWMCLGFFLIRKTPKKEGGGGALDSSLTLELLCRPGPAWSVRGNVS
jgi:hypothetical protein